MPHRQRFWQECLSQLSGGRTLDRMIKTPACAIWLEGVMRIEAAAAPIAFHRMETEDQVTLRWHQLTTRTLGYLYVRSRHPA
jgi:hypothetical protein